MSINEETRAETSDRSSVCTIDSAEPGEDRRVPVPRNGAWGHLDTAVADQSGSLSRLVDHGIALLSRFAEPALRVSLGVVFIWFGALKVFTISPVTALVHATLPWIAAGVLLPTLGWIEMLLGAMVLSGRLRRLTLVVLAGHLTGTFLTFLIAPRYMIMNGDPLLLTSDGEFVVKNLVLISAALVLLSRTKRR